jgi:hypothetical protein
MYFIFSLNFGGSVGNAFLVTVLFRVLGFLLVIVLHWANETVYWALLYWCYSYIL